MADELVLGIDLGTTYSAVACIVDGDVEVVRNRLGELTTPSVVHFASAGTAVVGAAARDSLDPENTVELIKRRMGTVFELMFHGARHTPESVSALILRSLVDDAIARFGPHETVRAVITVPAYFGIREREATLQAARLAGIDVLEVLSEPAAAALHYATQAESGAALVYDLGGGTFDTTVLRVAVGEVHVVATDGDSRLGGTDWNERIAEHLADAFAREFPDADPDDEDFQQQLRDVTEQVKRQLSTVTGRRVGLRCGADAASFDIDRKTLEDLGADLVDRTLRIVDRALAAAAEKGVSRIDEVLLVGGATKMPAIRTALQAHLGRAPKIVDPDLAVVSGAAVRARRLASSQAGARTTAAVVPRSFGVLIEDSHDEKLRSFTEHLVHRNEPLPAVATARFATIVDRQRSVRIQVFEQSGDVPSPEVEHNRRVLDGEFAGLPPLPAGSVIEVTLRVSADGLLAVTAREPLGGAALDLEAYVDGVVDGAETDQLAKTIAGLSVRC
ncbi:Hsp70 family protein [Saccharopolyspora sp. ASAGF58]|uniref:Hsp70 family protein n=1 Tax=Saccharopolyspora sp. ASAGF58 TaxID=2719023 RepID=UPI0014402B12|nr:Hsp70 family protein [Saccharopolyspora sp. ASAGF58]QIZ36257.1 Hsp70 family protein [Saccharopolyspora sp. ASAGF58]